MKFPWKWPLFRKNRRRVRDVEPATADDPDALQQQLRGEFRRQAEIEQEITRQRGMHGGGP